MFETSGEEAYTSRGLHDGTDVARTTIERILNELSDRDWIERTTNGEYVTIPIGRQV